MSSLCVFGRIWQRKIKHLNRRCCGKKKMRIALCLALETHKHKTKINKNAKCRKTCRPTMHICICCLSRFIRESQIIFYFSSIVWTLIFPYFVCIDVYEQMNAITASVYTNHCTRRHYDSFESSINIWLNYFIYFCTTLYV